MTYQEMARCLMRLKLVLTQWAPKEIDQDVSVIWLNVLKDFTDTQIKEAFLKAASELTEFPSPATIKRICQGSNKNDDDHGIEIAARIEGAISHFGYTNWELAKPFLGELGCKVVSICGGWLSLCNVSTDELPSARKRWREYASIAARNHFNNTDQNLTIGPQKSNPALSEVVNIALTSH